MQRRAKTRRYGRQAWKQGARPSPASSPFLLLPSCLGTALYLKEVRGLWLKRALVLLLRVSKISWACDPQLQRDNQI